MMLEQRRRRAPIWLAAAAIALVAVAGGCNDSRSESRDAGGKPPHSSDGPKKAAAGADAEAPQQPAVAAKVGPDGDPPHGDDSPADRGAKLPAVVAPPPGALPEVALTAAHRATCKVLIGDALPTVTLADLDGTAAPLDKLLGERLTVVMFAQHDDPDAVEALSDFGPLVLARYGDRGVRAIAIHVGDAAAEVKSIAGRHRLAFPLLLDADGSALAQVTDDPKGLMPRIFLVDSGGRILWFDIEYSRTTRRDLDRALRSLTRQ